MNTVQKIETGLVELFAAALPDFKVGAAGDQQAMTAYESESGALVIAAGEWKQEYPHLPDYRVTVHLTGRTSVDADPDRGRITELLTLTQRAAAALTPAQLSEALGETALGWLPQGFAQGSIKDEMHGFEVTYELVLTDVDFQVS
jgi:hypothetical protein